MPLRPLFHSHLELSYIAILLDEQIEIFQNQGRGRCPCDPYVIYSNFI